MSTRETMRAAMLAASTTGKTESTPAFAPRMDLWYIANQTRGALPAELAVGSTAELADALEVGCHAVRADYTRPREPGDLALRGLGFDNHPDYPYRLEAPSVGLSYRQDGDVHTTVVSTPFGDVSWVLRATREMAAAGVSLPFVESYPVEDVSDLDAVAWLFERLRLVPTPEGYAGFAYRVGDRGVAVANGCVAASPMHLLLHDLMPMDRFFYAYHDNREALRRFCRRIEPFFDSVLDCLVETSAEVILWGGNYDADLTWPPFYADEIQPWLQSVARRLRGAGKILLCHTDGENKGLTGMYRSSGFAVAESVCPAPMTSMTLSDLRTAMGPGICVWGGVPSIVLLESSFSDTAFESWLAAFAEEALSARPEASPLIVGVSDNVPPDADLERLRRIGSALR